MLQSSSNSSDDSGAANGVVKTTLTRVQHLKDISPEAFLTITGLLLALLLAFLYFVVKPWVESLTWEQWQPILDKGTKLLTGIVLIAVGLVIIARFSIRRVPENHTAVIRTRINRAGSIPYLKTEGAFVQWPWLKFTLYDTRAHRTEMRVECHTQDGIPVTVFALVRWALDHEQLHLLSSLTSSPVQHLADIAHKQLTDLVSKHNLIDLASQVSQISTQLQTFLKANLYGDTRTGIAVSEAEVVGFDAPRTRMTQFSAGQNR